MTMNTLASNGFDTQLKRTAFDPQASDEPRRIKMRDEVHILIADDDMGHATLIRRNLKRAGLPNKITHFKDGKELLDFLFDNGKGSTHLNGHSYLLLLDIRMPKVDGVEALNRIKEDSALKKIPVIMLTTTDDPGEIEKCHTLGCNSYIVKPINYEKFVEAIKKLGVFLRVIEVPKIDLA
jgi:CheY-like chemotaxis protein